MLSSSRSWRTFPAAQQPDWPDPGILGEVAAKLAASPPLVSPQACDRLRDSLADAGRGEAFLLQGGDCAETFAASDGAAVAAKVRLLSRMATVIARGTGLPVVTVGRLAGQYSKPRSASTETRNGTTLPVYRGDAVNGTEFTAEARTPDPARLVHAYHVATATLSRLPKGLFTSHEALLLPYEEALARVDPATGRRYGSSGHLLWIGERTRQPNGGHVVFAAGISNPVAVKLGPAVTGDDVLRLAELLNPDTDPGRLTLITRMGASQVRDVLPPLVERVTNAGAPVTWVCDPMHGNTRCAPSGHKTRVLDDVIDEMAGFFEVHRSLGTHPGGIHLEMTGEDVTECVGGNPPVSVSDLRHRYETACDPRLNPIQALEVAAAVTDLFTRPAPTVSTSIRPA